MRSSDDRLKIELKMEQVMSSNAYKLETKRVGGGMSSNAYKLETKRVGGGMSSSGYKLETKTNYSGYKLETKMIVTWLIGLETKKKELQSNGQV